MMISTKSIRVTFLIQQHSYLPSQTTTSKNRNYQPAPGILTPARNVSNWKYDLILLPKILSGNRILKNTLPNRKKIYIYISWLPLCVKFILFCSWNKRGLSWSITQRNKPQGLHSTYENVYKWFKWEWSLVIKILTVLEQKRSKCSLLICSSSQVMLPENLEWLLGFRIMFVFSKLFVSFRVLFNMDFLPMNTILS